jgi:hypothetical protein
MKQAVKAITLAVSHLAVFIIGGALVASYLIQREVQIAGRDPLHRLGLTLAKQPIKKNEHLFVETDLSAWDEQFRAPTVDVVHLVALLRQGKLDEASRVCSSLEWEHCDAPALRKMKEVSGL